MSRSISLILVFLCGFLSTVYSQTASHSDEMIKLQLEKAIESGHCTAHLDSDHPIHINRVSTADNVIQVYIETHKPLDEYTYMLLLESWLPAVYEFEKKDLAIFSLDERGTYIDLENAFTKQVPSSSEYVETEKNNLDKGDHVTSKITTTNSRQNNASGSLNDKTVWISPGHGWLWNNGLNDYLTQR